MVAIITNWPKAYQQFIEEYGISDTIMIFQYKQVVGRTFDSYVFIKCYTDIRNEELSRIIEYLEIHGAKDKTLVFT